MDSFSLIQHYFAQMACNFCDANLEPEGIELIREQEGFYVVSVSCCRCEKHIGVAMVGVETHSEDGETEDAHDGDISLWKRNIFESEGDEPGSTPKFPLGQRRPRRRRFKDPELTKKEMKRFSKYDPISDDDVLEAHKFFSQLDGNWQSLIPPDILERCKGTDMESPTP